MVPRSFWLSLLSWCVSLACLIALRVYMGVDPGIRVYYSTPFSDWGGLRDLVLATANVTCPAWTPDEPAPPELQQLLNDAFCLDAPWPRGLAPANRSAACRCVADLYAGLAWATCGNGTATATLNTTSDARASAGDQAIRCLDRTPQYRATAGATDMSRVFPTGLAFYCNGVLFLCTFGPWLFFGMGLGKPMHYQSDHVSVHIPAGQLVLFTLFAFLSTLLLTAHPLGNLLNALGLAAVYLNLAIGLHEEEAHRGQAAEDELDMCAYATLPQLLPGYLLMASVVGFGRDLGAYVTAMVLGALLGLTLQFTWLSVGHRREPEEAQEPEQPLLHKDEARHHEHDLATLPLTGLGAGLLYLVHWAAAAFIYQDRASPYLLSLAWPSVVFVLLLGLWGVGACDALTAHGHTTRRLTPVLLLLANVVLTGLACRDAAL